MDMYPLTAAAIRGRFPATDDIFIHRLVTDTLRAFFGVDKRDLQTLEDKHIVMAIEETHQHGQRTAGLYLKTVPAWIKNAAVDREEDSSVQ